MRALCPYKSTLYYISLILLFSVVWINLAGYWPFSWWATHHSYVDTRLAANDHPFNSEWDHIAIALKTGSEVLLERTPVQLITFLATVRNKIIIGETPDQKVGRFEMIDVYSGLYPDDDYQDIAPENVQGEYSDCARFNVSYSLQKDPNKSEQSTG